MVIQLIITGNWFNLYTPKQMFNQKDLEDILTLINFHEDWDEIQELYDIDMNSLFDKVHSALDNTNINDTPNY